MRLGLGVGFVGNGVGPGKGIPVGMLVGVTVGAVGNGVGSDDGTRYGNALSNDEADVRWCSCGRAGSLPRAGSDGSGARRPTTFKPVPVEVDVWETELPEVLAGAAVGPSVGAGTGSAVGRTFHGESMSSHSQSACDVPVLAVQLWFTPPLQLLSTPSFTPTLRMSM